MPRKRLILSRRQPVKSYQSVSWLSTDGIIRNSALRESQGSRDNRTTYAADVTYDYTVNGNPLTGNKIRMVKVYSSDES